MAAKHVMPNDPSGTDKGPQGLFVGIGLPDQLARLFAGQRVVVALEPEQIALADLRQLADAEIGCLLLGGRADALDIIADLRASGFRGLVTVIAPPLPDPQMVERELKADAKAMTVRLVMC